jgi:Cdc6-like AAA superfamily ATPase
MKYLFLKNGTEEETERKIYNPPASHSEVVLEVIKSLPIHFKLILYSCLTLYNQKKKSERVKLYDVFFEYQRLTTELNFTCMSPNQVADKIREFDMLGLLKNKYVRKGSGQIKYIDINPNHQSQFLTHISVLQEEIKNIKPSELATEELIKRYLPP